MSGLRASLDAAIRRQLQSVSVPELTQLAEEATNVVHRKLATRELKRRYVEALKVDLRDMTPGTVQQLVREGELAKRKRTHNAQAKKNSKYKQLAGNLARAELGERPRRDAAYQLALQYAQTGKRPNVVPNNVNKKVLENMYMTVNNSNYSWGQGFDTDLMNDLRYRGRLAKIQRVKTRENFDSARCKNYWYSGLSSSIVQNAHNLLRKANLNWGGWDRLRAPHLNAAARRIRWLSNHEARSQLHSLIRLLNKCPAGSAVRGETESALRRSMKSTCTVDGVCETDLLDMLMAAPANTLVHKAVNATFGRRDGYRESTWHMNDNYFTKYVQALKSGLPPAAREFVESGIVDALKHISDVRWKSGRGGKELWVRRPDNNNGYGSWSPWRLDPTLIAQVRALLPTFRRRDEIRSQLNKLPPTRTDAKGRVTFDFNAWGGRQNNN